MINFNVKYQKEPKAHYFFILIEMKLVPKLFTPIGQLISKPNCQAEDSSKNERMNPFLLVCDEFSFVFWKNPWPEKKRFEII